ncbi:hypothetical protein L3Y34_006606 [Caenorhabditis briggsae]|uniref:Uncharacterized protein n=1 Tax=Caenorhabditis briggsae TaxID=6238 RepID=A0AAE9A1S8_CAEBR|nr:hypothetical protein L3Y34_006606 [Caenorhabditis briggsae]
MSSKYRQKVVGNGETTPKKYGARIGLENQSPNFVMFHHKPLSKFVYDENLKAKTTKYIMQDIHYKLNDKPRLFV